jgi:hypothetical protein
MNNVLPRGTYVKFDIDDYLEGVMEDAMEDMPETTRTPDTEPLEN